MKFERNKKIVRSVRNDKQNSCVLVSKSFSGGKTVYPAKMSLSKQKQNHLALEMINICD